MKESYVILTNSLKAILCLSGIDFACREKGKIAALLIFYDRIYTRYK